MSDNVYMMRTQTFDFKSHSEISSSLAGYLLTVADASDIGEIDLDEINSFLNGQEEYHANLEMEII
jgi:hypothetical protein